MLVSELNRLILRVYFILNVVTKLIFRAKEYHSIVQLNNRLNAGIIS